MLFGERIRGLRKAHCLTQRKFAELLNVDFTYISKIENGKVEFPPSEVLIRKMADILETDAEELLDLAGQFNHRALQELVAEIPEAGTLLRRLQLRQLTRQQIQDMIRVSGEATRVD
jgi:transcriptional regulator with XRE-family HTH domain